MIQFKKLLMINWLYYGCEIAEFENSNLITGETGSGKSAFIDALQIIILGDATGRYFNKSAGKGAKRTIRTYLKGQYGANEFKRDKRSFSTYIVGEFFDTIKNEYFCAGAAFDFMSDDSYSHNFFWYEKNLIKEWFLKGKTAKTASEIKHFIAEQNIRYKFFASDTEYRSWFITKTNIHNERFFKLFRNAVAYQPLDNVEDFIVCNICSESNEINVDNMKASISEYKKINEMLKNTVSKKSALDSIAYIHKQYTLAHKDRREQQYFIDRAGIDAVTDRMECLLNEMDRLSTKKAELLTRQELIDQQNKELSDERDRIRDEISRDADKQHKDKLATEMESLGKQIREYEKTGNAEYNMFMQKTAAWRRHIRSMLDENLLENEQMNIHKADNYLADCGAYTEKDFARFDIDRLIDNNKIIDSLKHECLSLFLQKQQEKQKNYDAIKECEEKIRQLEKGQKQYRTELTHFRGYMERILSEKAGKQIKAEFLADLIDITDDRWTDTVEGYMSRQKCYIIVEPEYYSDAYEIFKEYRKNNNTDGIGIIDCEKVYNAKKETAFNSLARIVVSDNKYAKAYVDYLLGNVIMVSDFAEMRKYKTAVTAEGILYKGYVMSSIPKQLMRRHLIGKSSVKYQLDEARAECARLKIEAEDIESVLTSAEPITKENTFNVDYIERLSKAVENLGKLPELNETYDRIFNEYNSIVTNHTDELIKKQECIEQDIKRLNNENTELDRKIGSLIKDFNDKSTEYDKAEDERSEKEIKFKSEYGENLSHQTITEETEKKYDEVIKKFSSAADAEKHYEKEINKTLININDYKAGFERLIDKYNSSYSDSAIDSDINSSAWRDERDRIAAINISEYENQSADAQKRAQEMFRNDFINKIKENIDSAKREISELNKALSQYRFGRVRYKFTWRPVENAELRKYYDMITDDRLEWNLFNQDVYEKYQKEINDMFRMISMEADENYSREQIEENITKYKSFQTYMKFDIVEIDENGNEQPLSGIIGGRSGGERQTPFYIAILASLWRVYNIDDSTVNSLRLVVFDEAFDKIDTSRIEEFINMLEQVGFQSVVCAPDNKSPYIAPKVDNALVVLKPNVTVSTIGKYKRNEDG